MTSTPFAAPDLGLTGPQFLEFYAILLLACCLGAWYWRYQTYGASDRARPRVDHLDIPPTQLAFLQGGPPRALLTSVAVLAEQGLITDDLTPLRAPGPADRLDPLQARVAAEIARGNTRLATLRPAARAELDALREDLAARGLGYGEATHRRARLAAGIFVACLLLLLFRFVTGVLNDRPVLLLFIAAIFTVPPLLLFARTRTTPPPAATAALAAARVDYAHLSPEYRPAYPSYGALAMPTAVALFGVGALAMAHPAMSDQVDILALGSAGLSGSGATTGYGCGTNCSGSSGDSGGSSCSSCGGGCGGCGGG